MTIATWPRTWLPNVWYIKYLRRTIVKAATKIVFCNDKLLEASSQGFGSQKMQRPCTKPTVSSSVVPTYWRIRHSSHVLSLRCCRRRSAESWTNALFVISAVNTLSHREHSKICHDEVRGGKQSIIFSFYHWHHDIEHKIQFGATEGTY